MDDLDAGPVASTIAAAAICTRELQLRQRADVVDEPGDEEERDPGIDARDLLARRDRARGDRGPMPTANPGKMPTPPKSGVGTSCQRSPSEAATSRRAAPSRGEA